MRAALVVVTMMLAACGAPRADVPQAQVQPLPAIPPAADIASSGAAPSPSACLAPWEGHADARFDPRPIDPSKLAEADAIADPVEQAYARARVHFEARHWVEAARGFREIAFEHPDKDAAIFAVQLYLECLNILGARAGRPQCYSDMIRDLPPLLDRYCTRARAAHQEECRLLDRVQHDVLRLDAQATFEAAEQRGDKVGMHAGAEKYFALVRSECVPPSAESERCDELVYNAAVAFLESGDAAGAKRLEAIMLDPKNGMRASPLAAKLTCRLAGACP